MRCLKCGHQIPENSKLCDNCLNQRELFCTSCGTHNRPRSKYCNRCGAKLNSPTNNNVELKVVHPDKEPGQKTTVHTKNQAYLESERKHVSVLFSDLSNYGDISDRIDPEEMREIMSRIFGKIVKIIIKYDGYVERIIWDGVFAVFGMPHTHEDDAVRAVKAAIEIQDMVAVLGKKLSEIKGHALHMQTGISTGLVITGNTDEKTGHHGITGDTVNIASRLKDMAAAGEILVEKNTHAVVAGYFFFDRQLSAVVKGKKEPVTIYRVLSHAETPRKVHRIHGRRATLIGRKFELRRLEEAVMRLKRGQGVVVCLEGDAGTGKSRLISELRSTLEKDALRWIEANAYSYSEGVPYACFKDMFSRIFRLKETDKPRTIREKLHSAVGDITPYGKDVVPFIHSLYESRKRETDNAEPVLWKQGLNNAVIALISGFSKKQPLIICIEDLHWADPSSVDLLRYVLKESGLPVMFILSYRPVFSLFPDNLPAKISYSHFQVELADLTPDHAADMVNALLNTDMAPLSLHRFVKENVEGNPFYLEEIINSLIESDKLVHKNGNWEITDSLSNLSLSTTIHGVISGRLDRLGKETKRILQEASVIGRTFHPDILKKITSCRVGIKRGIETLERLDLIRKVEDPITGAYSFKHAIVQDVVYKGLLKKERRVIHERIGREMETLYDDRLKSFYETIAFHFERGRSILKAADYLVKSGEKSLEKYSVEESHKYFAKAYEILSTSTDTSPEKSFLLIDIIIKWYFAFNKRGPFNEMLDLLKLHEETAVSLGDRQKTGMYFVCMGWAFQRREDAKKSYRYLIKALEIGNSIQDHKMIAYCCACLTWTCSELGMLKSAIDYGNRSRAISQSLVHDKELVRFNLMGMGIAYFSLGDIPQCRKTGETLIVIGEKGADLRTFSEGYLLLAISRFAAGDYEGTVTLCKKAISTSVEPIYSVNAKFILGYAYIALGKLDKAEKSLDEVKVFSSRTGYEYLETSTKAFIGLITVAKGHLMKGLKIVRAHMQTHLENDKKYHYLVFEHLIGKIYLDMVSKKRPLSLMFFLRNFIFLILNAPFARRKAEKQFKSAIKMASEIHAKAKLAMAHLDLGILYMAEKKKAPSRKHIETSIALFKKCEADFHLEAAEKTLHRLEKELS